MTFLSPSVLWFLGALCVPILIHLLNRFKQNKLEFSTIRFIKDLETSAIKKIKMQKLILLLLRIFCILCLVLMMARPVTQGFIPGWLSSEQESRLIVVIDNSASMSVENDNYSFLETSKRVMMTIMPLFKEETNIIISQTCPPKIMFSGQSNSMELRNAIKLIKPTSSYDNIWELIDNLMIDNYEEPIKEFIIFSDLMHRPDTTFLNKVDNLEDWKFYFIQPEPIIDNLGILNISTVNRIKTMNQLVKLNARVENSGELKKKNIPLELVFNNRRVGQVISGFDQGKEKEFLFQAYPTELGILEGKIVLPKDDYELDNQWNLTMPIMNQIRCSLIGSNINDIAILEIILKSIDPENKFLSIETRVQSEFDRLFFDDTDVVIIHNPGILTEESINDLRSFLNQGGGIIWFEGKNNQRNIYSNLVSKLDFPEIGTVVNAGQGFFSTNILSGNSDLLQDINIRNIKKELPEIFKYVKTKVKSNHNVHWQLNNSDPLLIEFSKGSGTVFYFSTIVNLEWNDLPVRGIIVPLLHQLIILTGTDEINTSPVLVDEPKWISIEEQKLRNEWEVISPSGRVEMIVPEYNREGINISNTNELGFYQVYSNGEKFTSFPTRLHYKEYINERIKQSDIEKFIDNNNSRWIPINNNLSDTFSDIRHGKSLWELFLLAALLFLLIETIIGKPEQIKLKKNNNDRKK